GRGININSVYRIQPRIGIIPNKTLNFFVEYEYTAAEYGKVEPEGTDFYKFTKDYTVGNSRFIAAVVFNF
ncbi:MAG: hypothetical protein J6T70_13955, partial [Bacteroidales bacterium]|nr:hypothetical protein [Bacteroidales bacterium]